MRSPLQYFTVALKGLAMGAADVVPGVSGGTIAFISGIYDELLSSINALNLSALNTLFRKGMVSFWREINGGFLLALFSGIVISLFSLSNLIQWTLLHHPQLLWAFFFGLVAASALMVGKTVRWQIYSIIALILGTAVAYYLTVIPAMGDNESKVFLFVAGFIAICAMILPGISGSFILLLLGAYRPVIEALSSRDFFVLAVVGAGCVSGLLVFSRVLKWLLNRFRNITIALLTGFLVGSLNKLWPWKEVLQSEVIHGKLKVILEKSVAPQSGSGVLFVFLAMLSGFVILLLIEWVALRFKRPV